MSRPTYVCCIEHPHVDNTNTLCGQYLAEWKFQSIDHAFGVAESDGSQLICPDCAAKAIEMLQSQTYDPS